MVRLLTLALSWSTIALTLPFSNGPFDPIPLELSHSNSTDWEAELAVVIGQRGLSVSEERAMDYVFGYGACNEAGRAWTDGPMFVTAAGVKLDDVRLICRVNGVERQSGSYKQMYFKIPRTIAELSRGLTL